jgi:hypothetical protein
LPLAAVAPSVARLAHDEGAPRRAAFVTLYAMVSPTLFFAAIEVPRQAIAVGLVPLWLEAWRHPRRMNALWIAPVASVLVHRMLLVPALVFVVAAIVHALPPKARRAALVVPVLICVGGALLVAGMIVERGLSGDFGLVERALLCAPVALLVVVAVVRVPQRPLTDEEAAQAGATGGAPSLLLVMVALVLAVIARPFAHPHTRTPRDLGAEARAVALLNERSPDLVVARRPLAFLYTATTGRDAFLFEPEEHWDAKRITRVVHGLSSSELATYLDASCTWERVPDSDYSIVREDCFRSMRAAAAAAEDEGVTSVLSNDAQNPSRRRPAFLRKRASSSRASPENDPFAP